MNTDSAILSLIAEMQAMIMALRQQNQELQQQLQRSNAPEAKRAASSPVDDELDTLDSTQTK